MVVGLPGAGHGARRLQLGVAAARSRPAPEELGYRDGDNLRLEIRSSGGDLGRLPALAEGLVRQHVDIIAAWLTPAVLAAKRGTTEIPIVMIGAADPVGMGIVANLAHLAGNITGIAGLVSELTGKNIELLREFYFAGPDPGSPRCARA